MVFDQSRDAALFAQAESLRGEFVIAVRGQVAARSAENVNAELATGAVEVIARELVTLNESETPPFTIGDEKVAEALRLRYRYLDLRRPELQSLIAMKHAVTRAVREFLDGEGFLDIETPILTRSTPEGARDYLVPSRVHPGSFYALPQSPQLFKQLLIAGLTYYQIAKCSDEISRRATSSPDIWNFPSLATRRDRSTSRCCAMFSGRYWAGRFPSGSRGLHTSRRWRATALTSPTHGSDWS